MGLLIVGFEFEYANTSDDDVQLAPKLQTYMGNGLVQTPVPDRRHAVLRDGGRRRVPGIPVRDVSETHVGNNIGGGMKMSLAGPLRLRLDYRVFTLKGSPRHSNPQRFYAGSI